MAAEMKSPAPHSSAQPLTSRAEWLALQRHANQVRPRHLRQLFTEDKTRGDRLTLDAAGIYLDYSKNRVTDETLRLLCALAGVCGLHRRIDAMFRGDTINVTEKRSVLH